MCDVVYVLLLRERQQLITAALASGAEPEALPDARDTLDEWLESDGAGGPDSAVAAEIAAEIELYKRERGVA